MRKLELHIGKKVYNRDVPESFNDMTPEQFRLYTEMGSQLITPEDFYAAYFNIPRKDLSSLDIYTTYILSSLLTMNDDDITRFIIPEVTLKEHRLLAPNDNLARMSFQQFITVDTYYNWYLQTKKDDYLFMMGSCLYLEDGEEIEDIDLDERLPVWQQQRVMLLAMVVNWGFIKKWLSKCYPFLFPSGGDAEPKKESGKKVRMFNAWSEIMDALVGDDLTRLESYRHLECMDVLRILNKRIKENREKQFRK